MEKFIDDAIAHLFSSLSPSPVFKPAFPASPTPSFPPPSSIYHLSIFTFVANLSSFFVLAHTSSTDYHYVKTIWRFEEYDDFEQVPLPPIHRQLTKQIGVLAAVSSLLIVTTGHTRHHHHHYHQHQRRHQRFYFHHHCYEGVWEKCRETKGTKVVTCFSGRSLPGTKERKKKLPEFQTDSQTARQPDRQRVRVDNWKWTRRAPKISALWPSALWFVSNCSAYLGFVLTNKTSIDRSVQWAF